MLPLTDFMEELLLTGLEHGETKTTNSCAYDIFHWSMKDEVPLSSTSFPPREILSTFMKLPWNICFYLVSLLKRRIYFQLFSRYLYHKEFRDSVIIKIM